MVAKSKVSVPGEFLLCHIDALGLVGSVVSATMSKSQGLKLCALCSESSLCERTKTGGPCVQYGMSVGRMCFYTKKLKISPCELHRLEQFFGTTKPAIRYCICEMTKTFTAPGQRMYCLAPCMRRYLARYLKQSIEDMLVQLSCGCAKERARIMKGVDERAVITTNWSDFVTPEELAKQHQICAFAFKAKKGRLLLTVHLLEVHISWHVRSRAIRRPNEAIKY